jgi:uroporphyrinogen decarboxylase
MGFPGLNLTDSNIKLAQQNYGEHYRVIQKLVETFQPDVVFPLMDLSVEVNAVGRYTIFPVHESATVPKDTFDFGDIEKMQQIDISKDTRLFGYVKTMRLMNETLPLNIVRGAYVTGPYTMAALMMGSDDAAMATITAPDQLQRLCQFSMEKIKEYAGYFMDVGAQLICILEPSAVMLGPDQFRDFSAKYVKEIVTACRTRGVATVFHICGNSTHLLTEMVAAGVNAVSLDSREAGVDLVKVAQILPSEVVIIGNISPVNTILNGTPSTVAQEVRELLTAMDRYPNFILSTGCDLPQQTPLDNIRAFMEAGRAHLIRA